MKATAPNRTLFITLFGLLLQTTSAFGQTAFAPYAVRSEFLHTAPGALGTGLNGYLNPAILNYARGSQTTFAWTTDGPHDDWGLYSSLGGLGFGLNHRNLPGKDLTDYRLSLGLGGRTVGLGLGYGWSNNNRHFGRDNVWVLGSLWRPSPHLSAGVALTSTTNADSREVVLDVALRPLGSERLTLFGELARNQFDADESYTSGGLALMLIPGLTLTGRYFDENQTVSIGLDLGLGETGFRTHWRDERSGDAIFKRSTPDNSPAYPKLNDPYGIYALHYGPPGPDFTHTFFKPKPKYLELNLIEGVKYRRNALFDPSHTLTQMLQLIDTARTDPNIAGIALNTSGMRINSVIAWELRQKLLEFKQSGKHIVAYIDRAGLGRYHFASVADRIVMDPTGTIVLRGYLAGQTYFKGVLEKLGIGFDEWRFFTYKSATEVMTRADMSAAEREQLQTLIDDFYGVIRDEVSQARKITPESFDRLLEGNSFSLLPPIALEKGLIDTLGRWSTVKEVIKELEGDHRALINGNDYTPPYADTWGDKPRIGVVYALGICAMDVGIRARSLQHQVAALKDDPNIRAVVLRVDSPGGDALASDLVAEALRDLKTEKPVIISQGYVAASGGYWLSMYGDAILATPNTVTGSIGVIGGWAYNKGLKEKLGFSTDHVKTSRHADLGFGMTVPLLGFQLPDRNLNDDEKLSMETSIRTLYESFIAKVAQGRGQTYDQIDRVAQGRVWSGTRALENGLIDQLGGLDDAIRLAKEKAGLDRDTPVDLVELPGRELFDAEALFLSPFGLTQRDHNPSTVKAMLQTSLGLSGVTQHEAFEDLLFRLEHNGEPLLMLPLDHLPNALE
jgi:protease-4